MPVSLARPLPLKPMKTSLALVTLASLGTLAPLNAATVTYLVDLGAPNHQPYVFKEGDFGLYNAPVVVSAPDTGDHAGFGYKNARYQLGSAQLAFPMTGAYNLGEDGASTKALIGSFFFSNPGREEVGSPVKFTLTTASRADKVSIAAIGSVQTAQHALMTVEGTQVIVDSSESFIPVVGQLTGKSAYEGSFATESGEGEANLGGLLITIESQ
ncbi:MAG: hypothetical protein ABII82_19535 [Verrucomicrobiota bacterium]